MEAIGIDIDGKEQRFKCSYGWLHCPSNELISLTIPVGVKSVSCWGNQLIELILPEGMETVSCSNNQLTHLNLPESVKTLWADKEVLGLEKYIGKVEIELF